MRRFQTRGRSMRPLVPLLAAFLLALALRPSSAGAQEARQPVSDTVTSSSAVRGAEAEPYNAGLAIAFDNDLFAMNDDDFDYTGGGVVTFAGRRAVEWPLSLDRVLDPLDRLVPYARDDYSGADAQISHALQFAVIAFTPDDLNVAEPIFDDRPYASFVGLANVRTFVVDDASPVYETSFALGVLGLDVAKAIQRRVHRGLDLDEVPEGWEHQISDGGEPTFRFGWARQARLLGDTGPGARSHDLKWRLETNLGYITETSVSLSTRWGRINTPWWSLSPDRNAYLSQASPVVQGGAGTGRRELYVWAGAKARLRAHNVFLQGQFRDSEVEFASSEVERGVLEAWLGVTWELPAGLRLSYVSRYQSAELKTGRGNRDMRWAGFVVTRPAGR